MTSTVSLKWAKINYTLFLFFMVVKQFNREILFLLFSLFFFTRFVMEHTCFFIQSNIKNIEQSIHEYCGKRQQNEEYIKHLLYTFFSDFLICYRDMIADFFPMDITLIFCLINYSKGYDSAFMSHLCVHVY